MLHTAAPLTADQLFSLARQGEVRVTLRALCRYVTELDGYLVSNGLALHAAANDRPLVSPSSGTADIGIERTSEDIVLVHLGLCLSQVRGASETGRFALRQAIAATAVRLGLLAQALDTAFRHLEPRQSFGRKVLHHQLVKAHFSASHDLITRRREELALIETSGDLAYDPGVQHEISTHFMNVSKLMGGHGFLLHGINTTEYLASLIRALYANPAGSIGLYEIAVHPYARQTPATVGGRQ
ncbi:MULTISPECIES: hypothetical protein [unclassified Mesorhizobium]|uniref:hypothetical protein n=1 Tax=unclassified Mesorhizobium TaxID=325217 RepID=UPI003339E7AC